MNGSLLSDLLSFNLSHNFSARFLSHLYSIMVFPVLFVLTGREKEASETDLTSI